MTFVTADLAERIQSARWETQRVNLADLLSDASNPYQLVARQFGETDAYHSYRFAELVFCSGTLGFTERDLSYLPEIVAFHADAGVECVLDVQPGMLTDEFARGLHDAGFYLQHYASVLYGLPLQRDHKVEGVSVRDAGQDDIPLLLDLWGIGFEHGTTSDHLHDNETERGAIARIVARRWMLPGRHMFIASVDGLDCAMAALTVQDGVGFLSGAATLPAYRGRGCQQALIMARMSRAALAGCDIVVGEAGFGKPSQRNMERCGLRIAYGRLMYVVSSS